MTPDPPFGIVEGDGSGDTLPPFSQRPREAEGVPSLAEIQRVRVWECSQLGHDFDQIMEFGNDVPVKLVCGRCGRSALVVPEGNTDD